MKQNYINHIALCLDGSGSMSGLISDVIKVVDDLVKQLSIASQDLQQETRVTIYVFDDTVRCILYDMDVMRLPSIKGLYGPGGSTALIDATMQCIDELSEAPQRYGDHAFLLYDLTDGEENSSKKGTAHTLKKKIEALPDNWTVAVLVPDERGKRSAESFGFPKNNIQIWDATSSKGVTQAGNTIQNSTKQFMTARASGIRSSKNIFNIDVSSMTLNEVKNAKLVELKPTEYSVLVVNKDSAIKDYVSKTLGTYVKGNSYYLLTKPETIQAYKQICVRDLNNGKTYSGANARQLLQLPTTDAKINPVTHNNRFEIYVQSTSVNRKLLGGTKVLVLQ